MTRPMPTIQKYMTESPLTIGRHETLAQAEKVMHEHHIRHLPVVDKGKLVGVISERDVSVVQAMRPSGGFVPVEDAMTNAPFVVAPHAMLDEVVAEMAHEKYGSAVVMHNGKVVGIFTAVDALGAFAELLQERFHK